MLGHALVIVAVVCCLLLGRWQLGRAEVTHSLQNIAYALQWPLFAVFFAVMWLRMLRLESRRLDEEASAEAQPGAALAAERDIAAGAPGDEPPTQEPADSGRVRVTVDDEGDPELAAYNRMLAELAARDQRSTRRR
jgi:DNA-binding transcriptional regulator of glucitol operon